MFVIFPLHASFHRIIHFQVIIISNKHLNESNYWSNYVWLSLSRDNNVYLKPISSENFIKIINKNVL